MAVTGRRCVFLILTVYYLTAPKPIADIMEANFFHKDNTVMHINRPLVHYAFKDTFCSVQGKATTKNLKDMMPEIMKQVGPEQMSALKEIMGNASQAKAAAEDSDEDQPPPLVGGNFQDAAKK
jgi:hypothetical protein